MAEVVVAFDVPRAADALRLADRLPGIRWAKLGPMLVLDGGPGIVKAFKDRGARVFLDLKWHDIPNTVAEAVRAAERLGVDLVTVHALGGETMLRAAVAARQGAKIVAVTVLTSHSVADFGGALGKPSPELSEEAGRLARMAASAGVDGVVTSPLEIASVKGHLPEGSWIVVPGIRPRGSGLGDQQRVADPRTAAASGATHLVVGRPILEAAEPAAVYQEICEAAA